VFLNRLLTARSFAPSSAIPLRRPRPPARVATQQCPGAACVENWYRLAGFPRDIDDRVYGGLPLEPMKRLAQHLGLNKLRKLDYVLCEAIGNRADALSQVASCSPIARGRWPPDCADAGVRVFTKRLPQSPVWCAPR
jgi:hypothetical protein